MKLKIARGTPSKLVRLFIQDSTSVTGAGLAGLTNASAGLAAYYIREGDTAATAIALVSGSVGVHSSGGFCAVDPTHLAGVYELGLPNTALAAGQSVLVSLAGAANMVPTLLEIELDSVNYQDGAALGLGRLDAALSTRATPAQILATPANLLATDATGRVTVAGYATGQDPASLVLANTANKLQTNASGQVQHDMAQVVPTSNTAQTVGDALNGARAQAFGRWSLSGTTLNLYAADGTTIVRSFTLDSATAPTQRT